MRELTLSCALCSDRCRMPEEPPVLWWAGRSRAAAHRAPSRFINYTYNRCQVTVALNSSRVAVTGAAVFTFSLAVSPRSQADMLSFPKGDWSGRRGPVFPLCLLSRRWTQTQTRREGINPREARRRPSTATLQVHVLLIPTPAEIHSTWGLAGYHVALSGCGAAQNQSGGLYEEAFATNVSSCHKSPVKSKQSISVDTCR